jgi:hypothetical protein
MSCVGRREGRGGREKWIEGKKSDAHGGSENV